MIKANKQNIHNNNNSSSSSISLRSDKESIVLPALCIVLTEQSSPEAQPCWDFSSCGGGSADCGRKFRLRLRRLSCIINYNLSCTHTHTSTPLPVAAAAAAAALAPREALHDRKNSWRSHQRPIERGAAGGGRQASWHFNCTAWLCNSLN